MALTGFEGPNFALSFVSGLQLLFNFSVRMLTL